MVTLLRAHPHHPSCSGSRNPLHSKVSTVIFPCLWNVLLLPCSPPPWNSWLDTMVEPPLEDSVPAQLCGNAHVWLGRDSAEGCIYSVPLSHTQCQDSCLPDPRGRHGNNTTINPSESLAEMLVRKNQLLPCDQMQKWKLNSLWIILPYCIMNTFVLMCV